MADLSNEQLIANRAWQMFNASLNQGCAWDDARADAISDAKKLQEQFNTDFDSRFASYSVIEQEHIWNKKMDNFNKLIQTIQAI